MPNQFPMSDEEGEALIPYTFTVINNCDTSIAYNVNLETLGDANKSMRATSIKAILDSNASKTLDKYKEANTTLKEAYEAFTLDTHTVNGYDVASHSLKLWIDSEAPVSEMNKMFKSKITVSAGQNIFDGTEAELLASKGLAYGDYVDYTYDEVAAYKIKKEHSGWTIDQYVAQMYPENGAYEWRVFGADDEGNVELALVLATDKNNTGVIYNYDSDRNGKCDQWCDADGDGVVDAKVKFDQAVPTPNVDPKNSTPTTRFTLSGAVAYNNGVFLLNEAASKLYSNKELGITARSINIDDIYDMLNDTGKAAIENISNYKKEYTQQLHDIDSSKGLYYPSLYALEKYSGVSGTINNGGIDVSDSYYASVDELSTSANSTVLSTTPIKVMRNFWGGNDWENKKDYFINDKLYNMFIPKGNPNSGYWIASRFVDINENNYLTWGINSIMRKSYFSADEYMALSDEYKFDSATESGYTSAKVMFLLPVVTIPDEVKIVTNNSANSVDNMWTLKN